MKKINNKGQAMAEFIVLVPLIFGFLVAVTQITTLAIKAQKLDMAAYYGARLYSKHSIRGIKKGSVMQLEEKRQEIIGLISYNISNFLKTGDVYVDIDKDNNLILIWPVFLNIFGYVKSFTLTSKATMENEPLSYGGGRYYDPSKGF